MSKIKSFSRAADDETLYAPMREADIIRRPVVAYCDSAECLLFTKKKVSRVEVKAAPNGTDCSWCGHALFWQAEGKDPFEMTQQEYESETEMEIDHV